MTSKILSDGSTAAIESWNDPLTNRELYRVKVSQKKGTSIALPFIVRDGTAERVEAIFRSIDEKDTFDDVFHRAFWE